MLKLLIVDDEPLVREGLKCSISWERIGFSIVGEAANGIEALQKIRQLHPDVVLTDMSMSVMDGISLIENLTAAYPHIKIVILTAYNNFTYAKAALDHNVFAYISKPALNDEIISVFCRLKEKMEQDYKLQNTLISYQNHQMDDLLTDLLYTKQPTQDEIANFTQHLNGVTDHDDFYVAILEISTNSPKEFHVSAKEWYSFLNERLDYYLSISKNPCVKAKLSLQETALLVFTKTHDLKQQTELFRSLNADFAEQYTVKLTIGISATFRNLKAIHRAYMQAREALEQKVQFGSGSIIDYMTIGKLAIQTPIFSDEEIAGLVQSTSAADDMTVIDTLHTYFDSLKNHVITLTDLKENIIELITAAIQEIFYNARTLNLLFHEEIRPANDINAYSSTEEIQQYTMNFFHKVLAYTKAMHALNVNPEKYSSIVNKTIVYIYMHYAKEVKISDVAAQLYISESHLMHSFKKETGKSFNVFLTEYRIRLSELLLQSGYYKIYEISELVGYNNPITFRKSFMKVTGATPSKRKL